MAIEKILAAGFAFLIGTVGLWTAIKQLMNCAMVSRWPTTKGRVIERGTFRPSIATASSSAFRYAPLLKYVYQVDGREFTNDRIHAQRIQQPQHSTQQWAQKKADSFPDEVVVRYNPQDPSESFLNQTSRLLLVAILAASVFAFLFGLILLVTK
jgi:hypothetical protein